MLDDLVKTIEVLQERIRLHGAFIGALEKRTRASLIDPMLRALGWDVADPQLVHVEPKTSDGWADYALLNSHGTPVIFIEAKKLSDKFPPVKQVLGYALAEKQISNYTVPFAATTNGDEWTIYDIYAKEGKPLQVSLQNEASAECAFKLLGLWRDSLVDGNLRTATKLSTDVVQGGKPPEPPPTPPPMPSRSGVTLANFEGYGNRAKPPQRLIFPGGDSIEVSGSWGDLQAACVQWLIDANQLTADMCPLRKQGGTLLVDKRSSPKFRRPRRVGRLWIEVNRSGEGHVKKAREILELCDVDPAKVDVVL